MLKKIITVIIAILLLGGCARNPAPKTTETPGVSPSPTDGQTSSDRELTDEPVLDVYVVSDKQVKNMGMEEYLQGVLAGEMRNDWPLEALKAQAIIARTFAVKFLDDRGGSKYEGADISTDIEEAQAYDASGVNDLIKQAIDETRGMVITYQGEPIYTWFHAHAGGRTALAVEGLEYEGGDQPYIQSVESPESETAPADAKEWTATFTAGEIIAAAKALGYDVSGVSGFSIAEKGESGRATFFECAGVKLPAASFRVKIGADKLRSTLITDVSVSGDSVTFTGKGFGHGVGMSQWGAYQMAESGKSAEEIVNHYYADVEIEKFWE